ncbi:MAG TPA: UDP-N-acetylglucosamine 2-epimerase (non-hydrolyzing), partial [Polyangiaceae bacterium]|nr:UDP-N-acetylglucosamine 2-epimerase (non-hydrolyzing) [Polyangiaceae bacterium]
MHVVGARPNFMKLAPCHRAFAALGDVEQLVVHTGQHYDDAMSDSFFRDLEIPPPDINLGVGSASHAVQTARIMERFEPVALEHGPEWVVVYGDVNSTAAVALVCSKIDLRLAHVEAGLRSGDRSMPEEINRLVTDRLADLLLTPSRDADENLRREGVESNRIVFVGNVMVDTLLHGLPRARKELMREQLGLREGEYALVTIHRPSNVDAPERLADLMRALGIVARQIPVVFPVHPRTRSRLSASDRGALAAVNLLDPLPYHRMLDLTAGARLVITDSGGLQEETTALGIPCLTVRENTERPVTVTEGTNQLAPDP